MNLLIFPLWSKVRLVLRAHYGTTRYATRLAEILDGDSHAACR
jgi:hypothetical protein